MLFVSWVWGQCLMSGRWSDLHYQASSAPPRVTPSPAFPKAFCKVTYLLASLVILPVMTHSQSGMIYPLERLFPAGRVWWPQPTRLFKPPEPPMPVHARRQSHGKYQSDCSLNFSPVSFGVLLVFAIQTSVEIVSCFVSPGKLQPASPTA